MAPDHPVLGVGPGQYELNIQPYRSVAEMRESDPQRLGRSAGMAHNDFLQHVAETGALGGAVLVLVLVALVRKSAAHLRGQEDRGSFLLTAGLLGGVLGTAGAGLVGGSFHQPAVGALAMLFLGVSERVGDSVPETRLIPISRAHVIASIVAMGLLTIGLLAGVIWVATDCACARFLSLERSSIQCRGKRGAGCVDDFCRTVVMSGGDAMPLSMDRWEIRRAAGLSCMRIIQYANKEEAILHLSRALKLHPNDPETWNAWGVLCRETGKYKEGCLAFERAVQLDPIVRQPRLNLALAYEQDGLLDKELAQYEALAKLDSRDAEAQLWRGMTLVKLGRHAEAAAAFTAAEKADLYAGYVRLFDLRGRLLKRQDELTDALRTFRESEAGKAWLGLKRD
jgi:hypothetical protein